MLFVMIISAIVMGCAIPIVAIWTKHKEKVAGILASSKAENSAETAAKNKDLEDRVRVLERIVTDKGYDVASQIEALRDVRGNDEQIAHQPAKELS